ncbi:MAG TPA: sortase [Aggregatilineales bacterium]|nr:sortase [Anaerolineales bacterium]HRE48129.1 sortase [Aggregatilineales bacterium]
MSRERARRGKRKPPTENVSFLAGGLLLLLTMGGVFLLVVTLTQFSRTVLAPSVAVLPTPAAEGWWMGAVFENTATPPPTTTPLSLFTGLNPTAASTSVSAPSLLAQTVTPTEVLAWTPPPLLSPTPTATPRQERATVVAFAPVDVRPPPSDQFRLQIPKLGLDLPVINARFTGTTWDFSYITSQAAHLEGLALPGAGNTVIGAHSELAKRARGPFYDLKLLRPGDVISVWRGGVEYRYVVQRSWLVVPSDISPINQRVGDVLTLLTCDGYNSRTSDYDTRLIVRATRTS